MSNAARALNRIRQASRLIIAHYGNRTADQDQAEVEAIEDRASAYTLAYYLGMRAGAVLNAENLLKAIAQYDLPESADGSDTEATSKAAGSNANYH